MRNLRKLLPWIFFFAVNAVNAATIQQWIGGDLGKSGYPSVGEAGVGVDTETGHIWVRWTYPSNYDMLSFSMENLETGDVTIRGMRGAPRGWSDTYMSSCTLQGGPGVYMVQFLSSDSRYSVTGTSTMMVQIDDDCSSHPVIGKHAWKWTSTITNTSNQPINVAMIDPSNPNVTVYGQNASATIGPGQTGVLTGYTLTDDPNNSGSIDVKSLDVGNGGGFIYDTGDGAAKYTDVSVNNGGLPDGVSVSTSVAYSGKYDNDPYPDYSDTKTAPAKSTTLKSDNGNQTKTFTNDHPYDVVLTTTNYDTNQNKTVTTHQKVGAGESATYSTGDGYGSKTVKYTPLGGGNYGAPTTVYEDKGVGTSGPVQNQAAPIYTNLPNNMNLGGDTEDPDPIDPIDEEFPEEPDNPDEPDDDGSDIAPANPEPDPNNPDEEPPIEVEFPEDYSTYKGQQKIVDALKQLKDDLLESQYEADKSIFEMIKDGLSQIIQLHKDLFDLLAAPLNTSWDEINQKLESVSNFFAEKAMELRDKADVKFEGLVQTLDIGNLTGIKPPSQLGQINFMGKVIPIKTYWDDIEPMAEWINAIIAFIISMKFITDIHKMIGDGMALIMVTRPHKGQGNVSLKPVGIGIGGAWPSSLIGLSIILTGITAVPAILMMAVESQSGVQLVISTIARAVITGGGQQGEYIGNPLPMMIYATTAFFPLGLYLTTWASKIAAQKVIFPVVWTAAAAKISTII